MWGDKDVLDRITLNRSDTFKTIPATQVDGKRIKRR